MCKKHIRDSQDLIFVSVSQLYLDSTTASPSITEKAGGKWVKAETNKSNGSQDGFQASKRQWKQVKRWSRFREPRNVIFRLHRFHGFFVKKNVPSWLLSKKVLRFKMFQLDGTATSVGSKTPCHQIDHPGCPVKPIRLDSTVGLWLR